MSGGWWRGATGGLWGSGVAGRCPVRLWLARSGSCGGVPGLADGAEEFVAGTLNGLGGVEVAGSRGEPVERFEGVAPSRRKPSASSQQHSPLRESPIPISARVQPSVQRQSR